MNGKRKQVGLALGGGVARGWAHLGVLSVLEKSGIPIHYVAGSSAGSLVGSFFCSGMCVTEIIRLAASFRWWHLIRPVWPARGLFSFEGLERLIIRQLGDVSFASLKVPFAAMTTDIATGKSFPITSGRLAPAVRASCSVPGVFTPVLIGEQYLADGSISETIPVNILRQMGADYVVAVDIFAPSMRPRWGALGMGFNAMEILIQNAGGGIDKADCLISPELAGSTYLRLSKREQLFKLGERAAEQKLPEILEALSQG
jgi:NTE family protein